MPTENPPTANVSDAATPYTSRVEDVVDDVITDSEPPLAERSARLLAVILDAFFAIIPCGLVLSIVSDVRGVPMESLLQGSALEELVQSLGGIAVWALVNFYTLRNGQTIGKRILKIQVVDFESGKIPSLANLVLLRFGLFALLSQAGVSGFAIAVANPLMIFSEDRRCVHDYIARTKVIKLPAKR